MREEKLPEVWKHLYEKLKLPVIIVLQQQSVNRHLFEQILVETFSSTTSQVPKPVDKRVDLTCEEDNAVKYAAGYVAIKVLKRYSKKDTERAARYAECLSHMTMVSSEQESSFFDYALEWLSNIDRGGLYYINDSTFCLFKAIEVKTQVCLPQHLRS